MCQSESEKRTQVALIEDMDESAAAAIAAVKRWSDAVAALRMATMPDTDEALLVSADYRKIRGVLMRLLCIERREYR